MYMLHLAPNGPHNDLIIRVNTITGDTWVLDRGKNEWILSKEPK